MFFTVRELNWCIKLSFTLLNIYKIKRYIYINYVHKVISDIAVANVFGKREITSGF